MVVGVGDILDDREEGGEEGSADNSTQHEEKDRVALIHFRHADRDEDCKKAEYEGAYLDGKPTLEKDHGHGRAERGAGKHPEEAGGDEGVDEHGLKGCPRYRQGGPDQEGRNNARQSDVDEQILQKPGPVGVEMTNVESFVKEKEDHVPDWERVLAQGQ